MNKPNGFVHLHNHSTYSIGDSVQIIEEMVRRAKELGMPALAITDHGTMAGIVDFMSECKRTKYPDRLRPKEVEVQLPKMKPILGIEAYCAWKSAREPAAHDNPTCHLILLARNRDGYKNLCSLLEWSHQTGFYRFPRIDLDILSKHSKGLIALTACIGGLPQKAILGWKTYDRKTKQHVFQEPQPELVRSIIGKMRDIMEPGCLFLEVQNHRVPDMQEPTFRPTLSKGQQEDYDYLKAAQKLVMQALGEISVDMDLPLVGTNDCHYEDPTRSSTRQAAVAIGTGTYLRERFSGKLASKMAPKDNDDEDRLEDRESTAQMYLKSTDEMATTLCYDECPDLMDNTLRVADMVEVIDLSPPKNEKGLTAWNLPSLESEHPGVTDDEHMAKVAHEGLEVRYPAGSALRDRAEKQMTYELQVMKDMGLAGYHLIVRDYILWAKSQGILVGPCRGSAGGSVVVYCLGITDLDPLRHDLLFERYLNPERVSAADIDTDFDPAHVDKVYKYCIEKYGRDRVAKIATYGSIHAKGSVRNMARVMGLSEDWASEIAEALPTDQGEHRMKLKDIIGNPNSQAAQSIEKFLHVGGDLARYMLDLCVRLDDVKISRGQHAAGVVISGGPLRDIVPLVLQDKKDPDSITTEIPFDCLEDVGLLKQDLLSIDGLTIIDKAVKWIRATKNPEFALRPEWEEMYDDQPTYNIFHRGDLAGVWQMSGQGMRELCMQLQPTCLKDIAAICALYRPGPLDESDPATGLNMAEVYARRKGGGLQIHYDHPLCEPALKGTYGVIVFQEQIIQLSRDLCGWSLAKADHLRKAVGKKDKGAIEKQRKLFIPDAIAHSKLDEALVTRIWNQIETFGKYGFNISHATGYAKISYQMAYLKAHYPVEFLAACISLASEKGDKFKKIGLLHDFVAECTRFGISVMPPDIFHSGSDTQPEETLIRFGFGSVRDVAATAPKVQAAMQDLKSKIKAPEKDWSFVEVVRHLLTSGINRKVIASLINAGAFDRYVANLPGVSRASMLAAVLKIAEVKSKAKTGKKGPNKKMIEFFDMKDEVILEPMPASPDECSIMQEYLHLTGLEGKMPFPKSLTLRIAKESLDHVTGTLVQSEKGVKIGLHVTGDSRQYSFSLGTFSEESVRKTLAATDHEVMGVL